LVHNRTFVTSSLTLHHSENSACCDRGITAASSIAGPPEPAPANREVSVSPESLGLSVLPAEKRSSERAAQSVPSKNRCFLTSSPPFFMLPKRLLKSFSNNLPIRFAASFGTAGGHEICETPETCEAISVVSTDPRCDQAQESKGRG
jgi:hypothetical protein